MISEPFSGINLVWLLLCQFTGCLAVGLSLSFLLRRCAARGHQILFLSLATSLLLPCLYAGVNFSGLRNRI